MNNFRENPVLRTVQLVLISLIVVGTGLIVTQKMWVPIVVNFVLASEKAPYTSYISYSELE